MIIQTKLIKVQELISLKNLIIPDYQRPYSWKEKNVSQLLDDIWECCSPDKNNYRIGTVIIHKDSNKEELNIVDGQQRMVTITLILHFLGKNGLSLLNSKFTHADSKTNIKQNYKLIETWFNNLNEKERNAFGVYLLEKCDFVKIELTEISEAFQLFDSQNARGKALEPYDLLKAFHLREMRDNNEAERKESVVNWEKAVNKGLLNNLGKYIYRIRKWARSENAYEFTKDNIDEFKGINLNQTKKYPYLKSYQANESLVGKIQFPFQITQFVLSGKLFFEFVSFYSDLYQKLFRENDSKFYNFYKKNCLYNGSQRIGDSYVREMFEASVLFFVDKFGEEELEDEIETILCKWSYVLRLKQSRVNYLSIDRYVRENGNIFKTIDQKYSPKEIRKVKLNVPDSPSFNIPPMSELFGQPKPQNEARRN